MTGGRVLVIGRTGRNFAAGMSGGRRVGVRRRRRRSPRAATSRWSVSRRWPRAPTRPRRSASCSCGTTRSPAPSGRRRCSPAGRTCCRASCGWSRTTTGGSSRRRRGCEASGLTRRGGGDGRLRGEHARPGPGGRRLMGKPDGVHPGPAARRPHAPAARADPRLERDPPAPVRGRARRAGLAVHGLRDPVLPHRRADQRDGLGLPDQQPDPGVERPRLSRPVAGGVDPAARGRTTSRSSRAGCARRRARARAPSASTATRSRSRPSSRRSPTAPGRRAGSRPGRRSCAPGTPWRSSAPGRPASPPPTSSTSPATPSPCSSGPDASAAC